MRMKWWVRVNKPRPCKRKGGVDGMVTTVEVFTTLNGKKRFARCLALFLNRMELPEFDEHLVPRRGKEWNQMLGRSMRTPRKVPKEVINVQP